MIGLMQSIKMPVPSLAAPGVKPAFRHAARTCSHGPWTFCALDGEVVATASIDNKQIRSCLWRMRIFPEHAISVADYLIKFKDQTHR